MHEASTPGALAANDRWGCAAMPVRELHRDQKAENVTHSHLPVAEVQPSIKHGAEFLQGRIFQRILFPFLDSFLKKYIL